MSWRASKSRVTSSRSRRGGEIDHRRLGYGLSSLGNNGAMATRTGPRKKSDPALGQYRSKRDAGEDAGADGRRVPAPAAASSVRCS